MSKEDSSSTEHPCKNLYVVTCPYNTRAGDGTGGWKWGDRWVPGAFWPAAESSWRASRPSETHCLKNKADRSRGWPLASTVHMGMNTCTHTCTHDPPSHNLTPHAKWQVCHICGISTVTHGQGIKVKLVALLSDSLIGSSTFFSSSGWLKTSWFQKISPFFSRAHYILCALCILFSKLTIRKWFWFLLPLNILQYNKRTSVSLFKK